MIQPTSDQDRLAQMTDEELIADLDRRADALGIEIIFKPKARPPSPRNQLTWSYSLIKLFEPFRRATHACPLSGRFAPAFNGSSRADFGSISGWWSDLRPPIFVRQERPGEFK
jgi:hypothetical protein